MSYQFRFRDVLTGFLFLFFFIGIGLNIAIFFRPLYHFDIGFLDLESYSGFSKKQILENYNALIDYCSPFFYGELTFPSMKISVQALQHFVEVKQLFLLFDGLALLSGVGLLVQIILRKKHAAKNPSWLLTGSVTSMIAPVFVGLLCAICWDKAFVWFHKIAFRNDYWIFDWYEDEVIRILPDTFFLQCAGMIVGVVIVFNLILLFTGIRRLQTKRYRD